MRLRLRPLPVVPPKKASRIVCSLPDVRVILEAHLSWEERTGFHAHDALVTTGRD